MPAETSSPLLRPSPPIAPVALRMLATVVRALLRRARKSWSRRIAVNDRFRAFDGLGEMNEHALRDIGAPERLIVRAIERCDASKQRMLDGHRGRELFF